MMDPVTLMLAFTAVQTLSRLVEAMAQRWTLRGRAELVEAVAQLPAGGEVIERDAGGAGWQVRRVSRGRRR